MTDPIDRPYLEVVDPSAAQEGVDAPGPQSAWSDLINFGIYNGNFRLGPPQAASNIDVATSTTGSNFVPGWRFVQSSNTTITGRMVRNVSYPSGSNFQFVCTNSQTGHEAYIEQLIDMGGSVRQDIGAIIRGYMSSNEAGTFQPLSVSTQYLTSDGTIVGMPPERTTDFSLPADRSWLHAAEIDNPPSAARFLRVRLRAKGIDTKQNYTLDIPEVRRDRVSTIMRVPDRTGGSGTTSMYDIFESGSNLLWQPSSTTAGITSTKRVLNYQLIGLPFALLNVPANATTNVQLWEQALGLGTPRIGVPWPAAIVGMSYRISAAPTAGGAQALRIQATVAGANVWTAFTLADAGAAVSGEATQGLTADEIDAGQQVGVQVVTSATYAPTTADLAVVVWLAVKYDGA